MNLSNEHIITLFKNHSDNFSFNIKEQSLLIELLNVEIESYKKDNLNTDLLENILFKLKLNNNEDIIKEYYKRDISE
jgi:ribonucleotide reductase alpha subunit